jgi:hypothetical protein
MTLKSPRVLNAAKAQRRQLNQSIAETARQLVELVRERINSGPVSFDLVDRIIVDHSFVSVIFVDNDGMLDLTEWRRR